MFAPFIALISLETSAAALADPGEFADVTEGTAAGLGAGAGAAAAAEAAEDAGLDASIRGATAAAAAEDANPGVDSSAEGDIPDILLKP